MDDLDKHLSVMNVEALLISMVFCPFGLSVMLLLVWHVNRYLCHLWRTHLMYVVVIHHMDDAGLMDKAG